MGNYCFGRIEESESPRDHHTRSDESNNSTRLRNPTRHGNVIHDYYLPQIHESDPIFHPAPGISRPMSQLTEDEQILIATRLGLLGTLPMFTFDESKKEKFTECIICMCEYIEGEECRHLPCLHTFHRKCIDDWLIRSFTCPSCLEQVDTILLSNQNVNKNTDSLNKKKKRRAGSVTNNSGTDVSVAVGAAHHQQHQRTSSRHHHHHSGRSASHKSQQYQYQSQQRVGSANANSVVENVSAGSAATATAVANTDNVVITGPAVFEGTGKIEVVSGDVDKNEHCVTEEEYNTKFSASTVPTAIGTNVDTAVDDKAAAVSLSSNNDDSTSASALLLHESGGT